MYLHREKFQILIWIFLWTLTPWNYNSFALNSYQGTVAQVQPVCGVVCKSSCHINDNSDHRPLIKKKLKQGTTLVVDRYAFSGVAFTSAKPVSHSEFVPFLLRQKQGPVIWRLKCHFRVSVWSGASSLMWACRSRTSSCFCSSVPLRRLSEASLVQRDTRPVRSKEQFSKRFTIWWRTPRSTGRYDASKEQKCI